MIMNKRLSFFIYVALLTSFTSCNDKTPDECVTKLAKCELEDKEHKLIGRPGKKGEKGFQGDPGKPGSDGLRGRDGSVGETGIAGDAGEPGEQGALGHRGLPGSKGSLGDVGELGLMGRQGSNGTDGKKGLDGKNGAKGASGPDGDPGPQGVEGPIGLTGKQGPQGEKGDQGPPGIPATCGCKYEGDIPDDELKSDTDEEAMIDWGTEIIPGNVTCRKAPIPTESDEEKVYWLYLGPMNVSCDSKTKQTCIKNLSEKNYTYTRSEPFWLSEIGVSIEDIYNLKADQLSWLQSESYTANMMIRFHCLNSNLAGNASIAAMKLLTWNGLLVGPEATTASPFHYEIVNDGCSTANRDDLGITDIKLVSPIADRLPIVDFFINDVRKNMKHALSIQITRLCFY